MQVLLQYQSNSYYIIGQEVYYRIGRFYYIIGQLLHYRAFFYYIIGHILQYRAFITLSVGTQATHLLHLQDCLRTCKYYTDSTFSDINCDTINTFSTLSLNVSLPKHFCDCIELTETWLKTLEKIMWFSVHLHLFYNL